MRARSIANACHSTDPSDALLDALVRLAAVWAALALSPVLFSSLAPGGARVVGFGLVTALVVAPPHGFSWVRGRTAASLLMGGVLGWILYPLLSLAVAVVGLAIGLEPIARSQISPVGAAELAACVVLAPIFEEILYRARILEALTPIVGALPALCLSSVLFALPHYETWALLGTLIAGALLGAAWLACRDIGLCIGLHAGMNLSALLARASVGA